MQVSKDSTACIASNGEFSCVLRVITLMMKIPKNGKMGRKRCKA